MFFLSETRKQIENIFSNVKFITSDTTQRILEKVEKAVLASYYNEVGDIVYSSLFHTTDDKYLNSIKTVASTVQKSINMMPEMARIQEGPYYQAVIISLGNDSEVKHSFPIFIERADQPVTKSIIEGVLIKLDACAKLESPSDLEGEYWTNSNSSISYKKTSIVYDKDSDFISNIRALSPTCIFDSNHS